MPIYEYQCQSCDNIIEAMQSVSEAPLTTCPSCSGDLKKLISTSSFQLKGGGWYADGYSSNGSSCGKASAKSGESTKSETKSETTPATCPKAGSACCGC